MDLFNTNNSNNINNNNSNNNNNTSSNDIIEENPTAVDQEEKSSTPSNLQAQFLEDITQLKDFSIPTVLKIHRELCGKRYLTKRVSNQKKKVKLFP